MDVAAIVILVLAVVIAVVAFVAGFFDRRHDRARIAQLEAELGMRQIPDGVYRPSGFPLFEGRRKPEARWVLTDPDSEDAIFEFRYREDHWDGDPDSSSDKTVNMTCMIVGLPFDAPGLRLTPEARVTFGRPDPHADAEVDQVGTDEFRSRFHVYSDDPDFGHRLVDQEFEAVLGELWEAESNKASEGRIRVELRGRRMLVAARFVRVDSYAERLAWARRLRDSMPISLEMWYPPAG